METSKIERSCSWTDLLEEKKQEKQYIDDITWRWKLLKPDSSRLKEIWTLQMELSGRLRALYKQLFREDNELFAKEEEEKQALQSQSG